jgi:hypothetical protein
LTRRAEFIPLGKTYDSASVSTPPAVFFKTAILYDTHADFYAIGFSMQNLTAQKVVSQSVGI